MSKESHARLPPIRKFMGLRRPRKRIEHFVSTSSIRLWPCYISKRNNQIMRSSGFLKRCSNIFRRPYEGSYDHLAIQLLW